MSSSFTVATDAVAKIVAHAAATTPGVTRLAPSLAGRIKGTAVRATKLLVQSAPVDADPVADPDAIVIDSGDDGSVTTITVRIVASADPPVLQTVNAVHYAVSQALTEFEYEAEIVVLVVDVAAV